MSGRTEISMGVDSLGMFYSVVNLPLHPGSEGQVADLHTGENTCQINQHL